MDATQTELEERLAGILKQAALVASQIQKTEQGPGTPHYDQIEGAAHDVGQQLTRLVQQERVGELTGEQSLTEECPECRNKCPVTSESRQVTSVDGTVELVEPITYCSCCRRSFFPSAVGDGV